jgi:hypothetical protein
LHIDYANFFRIGGLQAICREINENKPKFTPETLNNFYKFQGSLDPWFALHLLRKLISNNSLYKYSRRDIFGGKFDSDQNFHSWIKKKLIMDHAKMENCSILDLACGMGGDLRFALKECGFRSAIGIV